MCTTDYIRHFIFSTTRVAKGNACLTKFLVKRVRTDSHFMSSMFKYRRVFCERYLFYSYCPILLPARYVTKWFLSYTKTILESWIILWWTPKLYRNKLILKTKNKLKLFITLNVSSENLKLTMKKSLHLNLIWTCFYCTINASSFFYFLLKSNF